ncbi:MAG: metal ABC transporter ATP-binding protein [Fimbriimonadaceae bacterium]|nr:metal ABC transporter ATP-binding protein [Fimbriimonadaceae bacterium]
MTPALSVRDLTVVYGDQPALWDVDLDLAPGTLTAIVGPNGAGKSTLLKASLGLIPRVAGTVSFFGRPLNAVRNEVAYVPQRANVDWDFPASVHDVALMGTFARLGWFRRPGAAERQRAIDALERVGMADLARRQIGELSGGQQQRVFLARALAQDAQLILLDEPLAGVDAPTETTVMSVLRELVQAGRTVAAVHHDLETAPEYFEDTVLLNVQIRNVGKTREVLTSENVKAAYAGRPVSLELIR